VAHKATRRRLTATVAGVGAIALVLSACGGSSTSSDTTTAPTGGGEASASAGAGGVSGDFCETIKSNWPGLEGKTITYYTTVGDE
jgi:ABC-type glycerol-3-phosphate transport system substrate-binding protein